MAYKWSSTPSTARESSRAAPGASARARALPSAPWGPTSTAERIEQLFEATRRVVEAALGVSLQPEGTVPVDERPELPAQLGAHAGCQQPELVGRGEGTPLATEVAGKAQ